MRSVFGVVPLVVTFLAAGAYAGHVPSRRIALPIRLHSRQSLHGRSAPNASAIAPVTYTDDKQSYYVVIQTGDINFRVALDTGSSDLWVISSSCSTATCNSMPRYPLEYNSPTFVSVNDNSTAFGVHFADGTGASGFVARETVTFSNLTLANQAFGLVTDSNVTFDDDISGILGLGFSRLSNISNSVVNATPFFATLAGQGLLDYPLFGVSLTRNSTGTLTIGAIDSSIVKNISDVGWNEVVPFSPIASESNTSSYLQWAIRLSSFTINGTAFMPTPTYPDFTSNSSVALLDIGTSGLYGPYQDVSRLFSMIDGSRLVDSTSGQWALPCDTPDTMSFTFGNQNFTLQPSDYLIGETFADPNYCLSWPRAVPPSPDGIDWQLGSAFLRTVYSVFSYGIDTKEPPMIGLYPLYAPNATVESASAVSSFLASESATIATTLPNVILPTPTYSTPAYAFNTSVTAPIGNIVSSGLATSTYSALLGTQHPNATALPGLSGLGTFETVVTTDTAGLIHTFTSPIARPSIVLGIPPGWNAATRIDMPLSIALFSCLLPLITFFIATHIIL